MSESVTLKGRGRELASLQRVLDANGPRVAFVYGVAGIGKSALLNAFASGVRGSGTQVWRIDCAAIDPTESSFRAALDAAGWQPGSAGVVLVDTYEMFRIADPWLRHELVPSLSTELRFVIAGRDAPMLEWSTERGRVGGLEILPLVGLTDEAAQAFLADANVAEDHADMICRFARGHPLSLRLAAEADVAHMPIDEVGPRVVAALATAFRAGLDDEGRRLLDAASVPRRVTMFRTPPSVLRPKTAAGPRISSTRSMSSSGSRSKLISSTVGSFTRTPSTNTLIPCGAPVTDVPWNPRTEKSIWNELPCWFAVLTPGRRRSASCSVTSPVARSVSPGITSTVAGKLSTGSGEPGNLVPVTSSGGRRTGGSVGS